MWWRRIAGLVGSAFRGGMWWVVIAPFCMATDLPLLATSANRPLRLAGDPDNYPITELLGRLLWFRSRLRLARAVIVLARAAILCGLVLLVAKTVAVLNNQPVTGWLPLALFLVAGWATHLALHHTISLFEVARIVDRRLALNAQMATAVESTLGSKLERALSRTQVRLATNRLRDVDPVRTVPLVIPWRDVRGLALIVVTYIAVSYVGTFRINLPRNILPAEAELAKQASVQAQAPSPYVTIDPGATQLTAQGQRMPTNVAPSGPVGSQLDALRQQLQNQQISNDQYQNQLKQVQQQLQAQATSSLAAQQALSALAAALNDVSTTQDISDSLNQGNYQQASDQLNQLSNQLGQLSPQAQSELANRLSQASSTTQKSNPEISKDSAAAASALKSGDTQSAASSMQSLANAVQQASQQIAAQSQLGQQLQSVQQQLGQNSSNQPPGAPNGNPSPADLSGTEQPQGQPSGANADQSGGQTGGQSGSSSSAAADGSGTQFSAPGQMASRSSAQSIQSDQGSGGTGAGSSPGGNGLGASQNPLNARGVPLTIVGQASGADAGTTTAGDRSVPLTAAGDSSLDSLAASGNVPSNVPITVHQESNEVPLERKPVVRGYFTNAGQ